MSNYILHSCPWKKIDCCFFI